jgi:hypothetical protein
MTPSKGMSYLIEKILNLKGMINSQETLKCWVKTQVPQGQRHPSVLFTDVTVCLEHCLAHRRHQTVMKKERNKHWDCFESG